MSTRGLVLVAWVLFAVGTVLGWAFRLPISQVYMDFIGPLPLQLITFNPVEYAHATFWLGLGLGVLSISPVVGMLIAGPGRTWRLGVVFLSLAVGISLGSAWLVVLEFRQMLTDGTSHSLPSRLYSATTMGRIFLSGPLAVWAVAMAMRVRCGGKRNDG